MGLLSRWDLGRDRQTRVMGIVNATPDSFSGDGLGEDIQAIVALAGHHVDDGADIIDIGGESTRPGAVPVSQEIEYERVIPAIQEIRAGSQVPLSVDTRKASIARAAIEAGADIVNDVSGLADPDMVETVRELACGLIIVHGRRARPGENIVQAVVRFLSDATEGAVRCGISPGRVMIDPGLGFGKSPADNLEILRDLNQLVRLGPPVVIGISRKKTISVAGGGEKEERVVGGIAMAVLAVKEGVRVIRSHDVAPTVRAVRTADAILNNLSRDESHL